MAQAVWIIFMLLLYNGAFSSSLYKLEGFSQNLWLHKIFFYFSFWVPHMKRVILVWKDSTISVCRFLTITTQMRRSSACHISALKLKVRSWQSLCCVLFTVTHGGPLNPCSDSGLCDSTVLVFSAERSMRSCLFLKENARMKKEVLRTPF